MDMGRFYDESLGSAAELLLWLSFFFLPPRLNPLVQTFKAPDRLTWHQSFAL